VEIAGGKNMTMEKNGADKASDDLWGIFIELHRNE